MTFTGLQEGRSDLGRHLLERKAMTSDWIPVFAAVPRAEFLPDVMWPYDMDTGTHVTVDRRRDPDLWAKYADADVPIVTQWDDGKSDGPGEVPTSSASMPSVVFRMLRDLDVQSGDRVLEVGTGTGWNAALLAERLGHGNVTSMEIDPVVAAAARERLMRSGRPVLVLARDGAEGDASGAPYDRLIVTAGIRSVPPAWLAQTRPGGRIVAPWGTHYGNEDAIVRLDVDEDGASASGRFTGPVEFMKLRSQRLPFVGHTVYVPDGVSGADRSTTGVTEEQLLGDGRFAAASFAVGLRVRDCHHQAAAARDGARPVWFYGLADKSWACVMFRDGQDEASVWQSGPRRLWDEVAAALAWWRAAGEPGIERFGLTVTADSQHAWLDRPSEAWQV
ncbi:methyltransferase domain-containing protein [Streptomyces sp. NBC_00663]|uniref:methyltransferase domain-containing protein n=1 Tax=Streptomyces sp. NBC_00663 TaxID=2975801 RepID=UPI002E359270|nr:methyltransferase domain-containing protein [Streptomyces sp. NBC_00663]